MRSHSIEYLLSLLRITVDQLDVCFDGATSSGRTFATMLDLAMQLHPEPDDQEQRARIAKISQGSEDLRLEGLTAIQQLRDVIDDMQRSIEQSN